MHIAQWSIIFNALTWQYASYGIKVLLRLRYNLVLLTLRNIFTAPTHLLDPQFYLTLWSLSTEYNRLYPLYVLIAFELFVGLELISEMSLWTKFCLARNRISVDLWKVHQLPRSYFNLFWIVDNSSYRRYEKRFCVDVFMQIFLRTAHFRIGEVWSLYLLLPLTCHLYRSWSLFPAIEQHLSQPFFFIL